MSNTKQKNPDRLPVGRFLLWKSKNVSIAAITIVMGYLTLFCTNYLGMSATLVGTLLMVSKIFDGITDIFAGFLVDNTRTKLGKARPYEPLLILSWLATWLLFSCPADLSMIAKSIWVFVMYTLVFSVFNTLIGAGETVYLIRAWHNDRKMITKVSSYSGIVTMFGSIIISMTFPTIMAKLVTKASDWRILLVIYAIPLALIGILRFIFIEEDKSVDAGPAGQKISIKQVFQVYKTNKYAWYFAAFMLIYNLTLNFGIGSYYFTYIVGNIGIMGILSAVAILVLPVMFIFPRLMRKFSVSQMIVIFAAIGCFGYLGLFFAGSNLIIIIICTLLTTLAGFPISYLTGLIIMNLATYNEYNNLPRAEASTQIVENFACKLGGGFGAGVAGILLGASGFISSTTGDAVQPASAILMIRCLYSIIPMVSFIIIIIFASLLGKLDKQMPEIEKVIKEKKEKAAEQNA